MKTLPPLDLHAHISPTIDSRELEDLGAVIFAVTRSLAEAEVALSRIDSATIWGVGCHPGVVRAQKAYLPEDFSKLMDSTSFAGELGLDGRSRVPLTTQREILHSALRVLATKPRVVSLHSYAAMAEVLNEIEETSVKGVVLHWWLGDIALTERAVRLGCYFSVNASSVRRVMQTAAIPRDRLLTETDHPFGDRRGGSNAAPGHVEEVERAIAGIHGLTATETRVLIWRNLSHLILDVGCSHLLPRQVRTWLAAAY